MEICQSSQMSFVGLMQLPHWKSNPQALRCAPPGQHPHDPNTSPAKGRSQRPPQGCLWLMWDRMRALGWLQAMGWGRRSSPGSWTALPRSPGLRCPGPAAGWAGTEETISCPRTEQCQKLGLWQGLGGLLWLCREGSHRPLSISLCLASSWGRDYKSP